MKLTESIILGQSGIYPTGSQVPLLDVSRGGQHGYMPKMGIVLNDKTFEEWQNNQAYIRKNVTVMLLSTPKAFDYFPAAEKLKAFLKSLIEERPLSIEGLAAGLKVSTESHDVGGSGGIKQLEPSKVTRDESSISITWQSAALETIEKFLDLYVRYIIMDPDTDRPLIVSLLSPAQAAAVKNWSPDMYTFSTLAWETDPSGLNVLKAWVTHNLFPQGTGDRKGSRDIRQAGEKPEITIEFGGMSFMNENTIAFAQSVLNSLSGNKVLPDFGIIPGLQGIDPELQALNTQKIGIS